MGTFANVNVLSVLSVLPAFALLIGVAMPAVADDTESDWVEFSYEPYPLARISEDVGRYPEGVPASLRVSRHGEIEHLGGGVFGTHWFVDAGGPVWHFVTAGSPDDDVVLMVHGYPDTWWANAEVMALLADDYYVIAVDVLGYGQSDKGPEIDVSYAGSAASLKNLLDVIGVETFNLISHDRGTIVSENLIALDGMSARITGYVRMQQSFDQPHGLPRPPPTRRGAPWSFKARRVWPARPTRAIMARSSFQNGFYSVWIGSLALKGRPRPRPARSRAPVSISSRSFAWPM